MEWDVDLDFEYDPGEYELPRKIYSGQTEKLVFATACQTPATVVSLQSNQEST
jgi:hypothetical protein